jgi:hypothetical protein
MPTHATGDLLLFLGVCNGYSAYPLVPSGSGLSIAGNGSYSTLRNVIAWKVAASASETSGTWTGGITHLCCSVYRSSTGTVIPGDNYPSSGSAGSGGNIPYAANPGYSDTTSQRWFCGLVQHRQTNTDIEVAPTGMTNRASAIYAGTGEMALHDTAGDDAAWPLTNYTLTAGSSSVFQTQVIELIEMSLPTAGASQTFHPLGGS